MHEAILHHFTPDIPLILVNDPDGLLADERLLAEIQARGFTVIAERDPVRLRYRYAHSRPPWVVVTDGPLNALPYDLWQQGQHVELALHQFFPNLAYPLVQTLTPSQRTRLFQAPPPARRLGQAATRAYIFRHVFGLDLDALGDPFTLVAWLSESSRRDPLPAPFREALRARLASEEAYRDWPLDELLSRPESLGEFIQNQWQAYLQKRGLLSLREAAAPYLLDFDRPRWQDALPRWLRAGLLRPVAVDADPPAEEWLAPGLLVRAEDARLKRLRLLAEALESALDAAPDDYSSWMAVAEQWAELTALRYASDETPAADEQTCLRLQTRLDNTFVPWLKRAYPALAVKVLPAPHHLYHVPHALAAARRQGAERLALVVLDGMSLADWLVLWEGWSPRHDWEAETRLLLAQVPTITAISRQALVSGRRPDEFAAIITHNRAEARHWGTFWAGEGVGAHACLYTRDLSALTDTDAQAVCLIVNAVDDIHHRALLGPADAQASLRRWRDHHAVALETALDALLDAGFAVWLTSDHGNVAAHGIGQPREGLIVQTRGKRARTYRDENLARKVQADFPETYLWHDDGLLPSDLWALMPHGRAAFAPQGEIHITHGGLTLDEVIVPLIRLIKTTG